jgi:hypothetical protein
MLNIRINFTVDVKKVMRVVGALVLASTQMFTPAHALPAQTSKEKVVTVSLQYITVNTTRTDAKKALASAYVKYFDAQTIAFLTEYSAGKSMTEWKCLNSLWSHESHFNPKALNMSSHAFGIAQFLPSTWGNYKVQKTAVAQLQIKYGLHYIQKRYGDACNAWKFWQEHGWY